MRRFMCAAVAAAAVMLVLLLPGTAHAQEDTVWCGNVKYDGVKIEKEDYDEIHFTIAGARQILPAGEVTKIIRGDQPPAFSAARQAREDGNWERAVNSYRSCARNGRREWVRIYSLFYLGECFRHWGENEKEKLKEAVKAFEQFLDRYSKHRFVSHATLGLALSAGECTLREKEKRAFKKLATGKYGTNWNLRGRLGLAQISLRDGGPASLNPGELRTLAGDARIRQLTGIWAEANLLLSQVLLAAGVGRGGAAAIPLLRVEDRHLSRELVVHVVCRQVAVVDPCEPQPLPAVTTRVIVSCISPTQYVKSTRVPIADSLLAEGTSSIESQLFSFIACS